MANPARAVILRAALRRKQQGIEPGQAGIRRQSIQQGCQRAGLQEHIRGKKKSKRTACRASSRVDGHAPVFSRRRRQAIKAGQGSPAQQAFSHCPHRTFQARRATAEHRRFSGPAAEPDPPDRQRAAPLPGRSGLPSGRPHRTAVWAKRRSCGHGTAGADAMQRAARQGGRRVPSFLGLGRARQGLLGLHVLQSGLRLRFPLNDGQSPPAEISRALFHKAEHSNSTE